MQTFYIDVYFLINFTVDTLAIYFASAFSKIPVSKIRLILLATCGAFFAILTVLLPENPAFKLISSLAGLVLIIVLCADSISVNRKIKFGISFLIFSALIGGSVSFLWGIFDKYIGDSIYFKQDFSVNRKLIIMSVAILGSIGVLKMIVAFFGSTNEKIGSAKLEIYFFDKKIELEAFVDSGNLAIDPMDISPILFIKKNVAQKLIPENMLNLHDPDLLDRKSRKRIRLIPVSKGDKTIVLTGFKADRVYVTDGTVREDIKVTIAIDREGGTYGGYYALMPSAALNDVKTATSDIISKN